MKQQSLIGVVIVVGIVGTGAGFLGGMKYAEYQRFQARSGNRQFPGGASSQAQGRNSLGGRPITGEVIAKDDVSITLKSQDGGSKIVLVSDKTLVTKTADGSISDIVIGSKVGVFGTENTDKSVTAQTIQLNPQFRMNGNQSTPQK